MAFAAKHQDTFESPAGYDYRVSFEVDGFVGAAAAMTFGETPHTRVAWNPVDGADEMGPLLVSECRTIILDSALAILADINSNTRLRIEQDVGAGFATYWLGYTSELTKRSANQFESRIEVHATDGLGRLKNVNYEDVFASSGRTSIAEAIHMILSELGYSFSVAIASNWYSYRSGGAQLTSADNPVEDRTIFNPVFYTNRGKIDRLLRRELNLIEFGGLWSCYDVLLQILSVEGLTLYQRPGGVWDCVQTELRESGSYGIWTYPSTWGLATKTNRSIDHTVSADEEFILRDLGGEWDKYEPYRSASVAYEHGKIGSGLLLNLTFDGLTAAAGSVADDWTYVGTPPAANIVGRGDELFEGRYTQGILRIDNTQADWTSPVLALNDSERILETTGTSLASGSGPLTITFNVWGYNLYIPIEIKVGAYWIDEDGVAENTGVAQDHLIVVVMSEAREWQRISVTLESVPATGDLYIGLWRPVSRDPSTASDDEADFGPIEIDYAADGESDKERTVTVAVGSATAQAAREGRTLYLGSGPVASTVGCVLDGLGGIASGFDRGVVAADNGVSMHQMLVQSYVQQRYAGRVRHAGSYQCYDSSLLLPFEIWQTPIIDGKRLGLVSFERVLDTEECIIREAIETTVSGSVVFSSTGIEAERSTGGTGVLTGSPASADIAGEIARRVGEILLTVTTVEIPLGAQTSMTITAYGGTETRLFDNDPFFIVDAETGEKHALQVNNAAHVLPADGTITFDSYTFPRAIPVGSAVKLDMRRLMENALRGGGDVDGALYLLNQAAPGGVSGYGGLFSDASGILCTYEGTTGPRKLVRLDATGKIPTSELPALALTDIFVVASEAAQLALTAQEGDVAVRTDLNKTYAHNGGSAGTMADWQELLTPTGAVTSVNGETGAVTLTPSDIGFTDPILDKASPGNIGTGTPGDATFDAVTFNDGFTSLANSRIQRNTGVVLTLARNTTGTDDFALNLVATTLNASSVEKTVGTIVMDVQSAAAGSETGDWWVRTMQAGTLAERLRIAAGLLVGSPTGGDKGTGTINAVAVYDDNTLLSCYVFEQAVEGQVILEKWDAAVPNRTHRAAFDLRDTGKKDDDGNAILEKVKISDEWIEERQHDSARRFLGRIGTEYDPLTLEGYARHWKEKRHLTSMPNESNYAGMSTGEWVQRLVETVEIQAVLIDKLSEKVRALEQAIGGSGTNTE